MRVYVVTSTISHGWPGMRSDTFVFDHFSKEKAMNLLETYCSRMERDHEVIRNKYGDFAKFVSKASGETVGWIDIKLKKVNPDGIGINEIPT